MNNIAIVLPYVALAGLGLFLAYKNKSKSKEVTYKIKVKFSSGIKTKLVLNEAQYEQFKAWLAQPEGIYEISSDSETVTLNRKYVSCVEVRRK